MADFKFENSLGSLIPCVPQNEAAMKHLKEHTNDAAWFGNRLLVEPRYVDSLRQSLEDAGFEVELED